MAYTENLWLFFVLLVGIVLVPGMDMLFVITNALTGGRSAGLSATAGVMTGGAVHTLLGTVSVGVLMKAFPALFPFMVLAGACYMAWIGAVLIRSSFTLHTERAARVSSLRATFRQGAVTCILNPKAYLFVFSVYPQFMRPEYGSLPSQALIMGTLTLLVQLVIYGGLALAAARGRDLLVLRPGAPLLVGRAAGAFFLVIAALAAWHGWTGLPHSSA